MPLYQELITSTAHLPAPAPPLCPSRLIACGSRRPHSTRGLSCLVLSATDWHSWCAVRAHLTSLVWNSRSLIASRRSSAPAHSHSTSLGKARFPLPHSCRPSEDCSRRRRPRRRKNHRSQVATKPVFIQGVAQRAAIARVLQDSHRIQCYHRSHTRS